MWDSPHRPVHLYRLHAYLWGLYVFMRCIARAVIINGRKGLGRPCNRTIHTSNRHALLAWIRKGCKPQREGTVHSIDDRMMSDELPPPLLSSFAPCLHERRGKRSKLVHTYVQPICQPLPVPASRMVRSKKQKSLNRLPIAYVHRSLCRHSSSASFSQSRLCT